MMPSKSKPQRNLMAAAEHGAEFGLAKQLRAHLTTQQLHDFATTPAKTLPQAVPTKTAGAHPSGNLGKYLHPSKK